MWKILLVLSILTFSNAAFASRVFVEDATGPGVSRSDLDTTTELIKTSVPEVSSNQVVDQPERADYYLQPRLLKLGSAYLLGLSKTEKNGTVINSSQLKASSMNELDTVAKRLTKAVMRGFTALENPEVGEITEEETHHGTERRPARKAWYLGIGGATFSNLNVDGIGYSLGVAYNWDLNSALIKIMAEGAGLDSAFVASAGIGGQYFLLKSDIAPYIGGDFGFGAAKAEGGEGFFSGSTIGGFDVGAEAGIQFLRTASVNLDLGFRAGFLLHSNSYGSPAVYSLKLGIYF